MAGPHLDHVPEKGAANGLATLASDVLHVAAQYRDFVGDSGAGGTKGGVPAPAIGDAENFLKGDGTWADILAQLAPQIANGTSTITRNVSSFATATDMSITPGAGDYIAFFGSYCQVSNNTTDADFRIAANGVGVAASLRTVHNRRSTDRVPFLCFALITGLGDGQAITGEWSRAVGGGTITIFERQLLIVKVGS